MKTIVELRQEIINSFQKANILNPILEAEVIISKILGVERYFIHLEPEKLVPEIKIEEINKIVERRLNLEPLAYLIEQKEFYSLEFFVNKNVLIPRPETEFLVEYTLKKAPPRAKILDLGTGSGAIAIALKYNRPDFEIYATDISKKALEVAKKNAYNLLKDTKKINFLSGDLFKPVKDLNFQIIISNPPYLSPEIYPKLNSELSYEPEIALFAADNGFQIIKKIISQAKNFLTKEGFLILEIDPGLQDAIIKLACEKKYIFSFFKDYAGLIRVVILNESSS